MKKKINRRDFLKVMGVVGMTASLAACGDSGSSSAAASSTAGGDDGVITISYWTTDRHDQAYLTPLIEEYNKTNSDNIYIDYQVYADNYSQMLDLAFSTDTAPDVFKLSGTDPLEVQVDEKKMLLDLSPYMTEEYKARFWDGVCAGRQLLGRRDLLPALYRICLSPVLQPGSAGSGGHFCSSQDPEGTGG